MKLFFTEYKLIKTNVTEHLVKTDKTECDYRTDFVLIRKRSV